MGNSRLQAPFIAGGEIFAAGTTIYKTKAGAASTVRSPAGIVTGQTSVRSYGGMSSAGTITAGGVITTTSFRSTGGISTAGTINAGGGYGFVQGNYKKFAGGTIYTVGGATAPITSTGLTTIHKIFIQPNRTNYSTATTGLTFPRPCRAAGTLGSFYPVAFKITGAPGVQLSTVAATYQWLALGL